MNAKPASPTTQLLLTVTASVVVLATVWRRFAKRVERMNDAIGEAERQRDEAVERADASEQQYRILMDEAADGMFISDSAGRYLDVNRRACDMVGYTRDELLKLRVPDVVVPDDMRLYGLLRNQLRLGDITIVERQLRRKDGSVLPVEASARLLLDGRLQASVRDITERKRAEQLLSYQVLHDSLTGLPNRVLLHQELAAAVAAGRSGGERPALLLLDLDRFKDVNDTLGHQAGDAVLVQLAQRLQKLVRPSDTVARLGGDEFALILSSASEASAQQICRRILHELEVPVELNSRTVHVGVSIGIALWSEAWADPTVVLHQADVAMYAAKRASKGYLVYDTSLEQLGESGAA